MIMPNKVNFDIYSIFSGIIYPPYSFLYGGTDKALEGRIIVFLNHTYKYGFLELSEDKSRTYVAETTATHLVLAVHMLFISVLILNLLIAVFG